MSTQQSTTASPLLLSPFDLRGLLLRNRVVMAPLTRARAGKERVPNALMTEYYAQRASAGLIISEATTISEQANGWVDSPDTVGSFSARKPQPFAGFIHRQFSAAVVARK